MSASREVVTINTPEDRAKIARWAQQTGWGTVVEFKKKTRSTEQNAKMHAMLGEVSSQVVWYGRKLSVEDWKNIFSASLRKAQVVPGIDPGTVVPLGIHTSTMTVDEMSNMIELIYAFGADPEHLVTFKEPNNPSSDARSPETSDVDGAPSPGVPSEPAADSAPVAGSNEPDMFGKFNFVGEDKTYLIEFVGKAIPLAADKKQDEAYRKDQLNRMYERYRTDEDIRLSEDALVALKAMKLPIAKIFEHGSAEKARDFIAREILDCQASELEGRKHG